MRFSGGVTFKGGITANSAAQGGGGVGGSGYQPTVGIDMTTAGALEVFVPGTYTVGAFAHRTGTSDCTTVAGVPAVGTTFYEPCFANASGPIESHSATSVYDAFDVPLMILAASTSHTGCTNQRDTLYGTIQSISEDNSYLFMDDKCGAMDIRHFTGASAGQTVSGYTLGNITVANGEARWLRGVHKDKIVYKPNGSNDLSVYKVSTDRWCTALSSDGLSDTCSSTTEVDYHTTPFPGAAWGIGGNEGDISATNILPITKTGTSPAEIYAYDVVAKTNVQMADVPTGTLDSAYLSIDGTLMGAQINGSWYTWTASTGAILNGGAASGLASHAGFGITSGGNNIRLAFYDGTPASQSGNCNNASFGPQRKAIFPWSSTTATVLLTHPSTRDPQTTCEDSHWSAHTNYPTPQHHLVAFDLASSATVTDQADVTAGSLNANWDNDWRYLSREIVVCDYDNPASDTVNSPNCWRIAHGRAYDDDRDCSHCVSISADGKYLLYRSHLGTDISGSGKRIYIVRAGPLR